MMIAGAFILSSVGFGFIYGNKTASLETAVVNIKETVTEVKLDQNELRAQVSDIVSKGVESGVSNSLKQILEAIEENRAGYYQPATSTNHE